MKTASKYFDWLQWIELLFVLSLALPCQRLCAQTLPAPDALVYPDKQGVYVIDGTNVIPIYHGSRQCLTYPRRISILLYQDWISATDPKVVDIKIRDWKFIDDKDKTVVPADTKEVDQHKDMVVLVPRQPLTPGLYSITIGEGSEYYFGVETPDEEAFWVEMLKEHPDSWQSHNHLGGLLYMKGDINGSLPHFQEVTELNPKYAEGHNNFGLALAYKGDNQGAIDQFKQAVALLDDPVMEVNLANSYTAAKQFDDAIAAYRHAIDSKPSTPTAATAHCNLGYALMEKGNVDEAIEEFRKASELDPNMTQAKSDLEHALEVQAGRK
jgi:tetratricopeptide (TPR) repeat protein